MSHYIGKYLKAVTSTSYQGDYIDTVYCDNYQNDKLRVHSKINEYLIPLTAVKEILPSPKPIVKYLVGSVVEFVYDYHQLAGESLANGEIISHKIFYISLIPP